MKDALKLQREVQDKVTIETIAESDHPLTTQEISERTDKSIHSVRKRVRRLREEGKIKYVEFTYGEPQGKTYEVP